MMFRSSGYKALLVTLVQTVTFEGFLTPSSYVMIAESLLLSTRDRLTFWRLVLGMCYIAWLCATSEVQDMKNIATFTTLLQKTHTVRSTIDKALKNA